MSTEQGHRFNLANKNTGHNSLDDARLDDKTKVLCLSHPCDMWYA